MKAMITVVKDDKMWEKIKKDLLAANKVGELEVGFFEQSKYGPENENLQVAQVAQWNNEGQPANNVPPRPFFTSTLVAPIEAKKRDKLFFQSIDRIVTGKSSFLREYNMIGGLFVNELKKAIEDWSTPPNAPSTVAEKGFNDPLIKTETMKNSVEYKIGGR